MQWVRLWNLLDLDSALLLPLLYFMVLEMLYDHPVYLTFLLCRVEVVDRFVVRPKIVAGQWMMVKMGRGY